MKSIILILTCLAVFLFDTKAASIDQGDHLFVIASSGVNVRATPSLTKGVLFGVGHGERVTVVSTDGPCVVIDDLEGNWIKVSYGDRIGYAFDGYLSTLPPPVFEHLDRDEDVVDRIKDYALMQLGTNQPKVAYNNLVDGEGAFKIDIYNLKKSCQYVEYSYWEGEGLDVELQLTNIRSTELRYILKEIFHEQPGFDPDAVNQLTQGTPIQFSTEEHIFVTIRKSNDRYSIFLEVASCC